MRVACGRPLRARQCPSLLWATFPHSPEPCRLNQLGALTYKSVAFVWLKQNRQGPPAGFYEPWAFLGHGATRSPCLAGDAGHPQTAGSEYIHQFNHFPCPCPRAQPASRRAAREKDRALWMPTCAQVELFARQSPPLGCVEMRWSPRDFHRTTDKVSRAQIKRSL